MSTTNIIKHTDENPQVEHPENEACYSGLQVNAGIEQPPVINPYLKHRKHRPQLTAADYV